MYSANLNTSYTRNISSVKKSEQSPALNFGGATRLVANTQRHPRPFMTTQDFLRVTAPFKSKVVGHLPKEFLGLFPDDPKKVFTFFDEFAQFARVNDEKDLIEYCKNAQLKLSSGKKIGVGFLGEGSFGKVLRLDVGDKSFAFKSFKSEAGSNPASFLVHGAVAETRTNTFLSDHQYKDFVKFHIADLGENKRWSIAEYIEESSAATRKGVELEVAHPELSLYDGSPQNSIGFPRYENLVRIDSGGIIPEKMVPVYYQPEFYKTRAFYKYLKHPNPDMRICLPEQLEFLPLGDRKKAFYALLNHPDPEVRKGLGKYVQELYKPDDINEAFYALLNHPEPEMSRGLSGSLCKLRGDRTEAFYALLSHPDLEVRTGLGAVLGNLDKNDRKEAFYALLNHPDARAKVGLGTSIDVLQKDERKEAFYSLLNHPDSEVRVGLGTSIESLHKEDKKEAFYALLNHPDTEARKGINLLCLDSYEAKKEAFYALLNHPDPEAKKDLNRCLFMFKTEDRHQAIHAILDNPDANISGYMLFDIYKCFEEHEIAQAIKKIEKKISAPYQTFDIMLSKEEI